MSENLIVESTNKTPGIEFDPDSGIFEITGLSVPENALGFYEPVIGWLKEYVKKPASKTKIVVKLSYMNTSSLSRFYQMLSVLKEHLPEDGLRIEWYYLNGDDDMKEMGEDFKGSLDLNIELIAVETV